MSIFSGGERGLILGYQWWWLSGGGGWRLGSGVVDVHVLLEGVLFSKLFGLSILRVKIFRCTQE